MFAMYYKSLQLGTDIPYSRTSSEVMVKFAKQTFHILPYHQPMKLVHSFWMSVHISMKEVLAEGLSGQCVENFGVTVAFEVKLAMYLYYRNESLFYSRMGFFADTNVSVNMSMVRRLKQCIGDMDLLKYLIYLAIYNEHQGNSTAYDGILKTAMKLFGDGTLEDGSQLAYRMGIFLCEVGEHDLAIALLENAFKEKPHDFKIAFVLIDALRMLDQDDQVNKVLETLERQYNESYGQKVKEACTTFIDGLPSLNCIKSLQSGGIAAMASAIINDMLRERNAELRLQINRHNSFGETFSNTLFHVTEAVNISEAELSSTFSLDHDQTRANKTINLFEVAIALSNDLFFVYEFTTKSVVELCRPYLGTPEIRKFGMLKIDHISNPPVPTNDWEIDAGLKFKNKSENLSLIGSNTIDSLIKMMLKHKTELESRDSFMKSKLPQLLETRGHIYTAVAYYATYLLSMKYQVNGNFEVAKNYTEKALKYLPDVPDVDDKVREFLDLKLRVAKLELALHNYVGALEILRNCSLTIAGMEDTIKSKKNTHTRRDVSKVWNEHEVSVQRQFVHRFGRFFMKPISGQQIPAKLVSHDMQFAVIFITVWCLLAVIGVVVIETHYFLYLLHASLSPVYRVYYAIPANADVWKGQPFLSLACRWTKLRVFGVTLILTVVSYLAYIIAYHAYNILHYLDHL